MKYKIMKKIISVIAIGFSEVEEQFINETLEDTMDILEAYEAKRWNDFAFYCRYGYFEDDALFYEEPGIMIEECSADEEIF